MMIIGNRKILIMYQQGLNFKKYFYFPSLGIKFACVSEGDTPHVIIWLQRAGFQFIDLSLYLMC